MVRVDAPPNDGEYDDESSENEQLELGGESAAVDAMIAEMQGQSPEYVAELRRERRKAKVMGELPTDDDTFDAYNAWRREQGLDEITRAQTRRWARGMRDDHKKRGHMFTLTDDALDGLRYLAEQHGAKWGNHVSVSALLEVIGRMQIAVVDMRRPKATRTLTGTRDDDFHVEGSEDDEIDEATSEQRVTGRVEGSKGGVVMCPRCGHNMHELGLSRE